MPDESPKPGPIEGGVPKVEAPQADPFAGPELPALDASAVAGLEAGGGDPSGVLEEAASGKFNPPSGYLMGEAAGGPPPTKLGAEAAAPAAASPAAPEAPGTPPVAQVAEQMPDGLPADHPDAPAPGFGPGGPTNRELAAGSGIDIGPKPADAPTKAPLDFDNMSDADRIGAANSADPEVRAQHAAWKEASMVARTPKPDAEAAKQSTTPDGEPIQLSNDEINRRMLGKTEPVADPLSVTAPDAAAPDAAAPDAAAPDAAAPDAADNSPLDQNQIEVDAVAKGFSPEDANKLASIIQNPTREAYDQLTDEQKAFVREGMANAIFAEKMRLPSNGNVDAFRSIESMTDDEISEEHAQLEANQNRNPDQDARYQALEAAYYNRDTVKGPKQQEPGAIRTSTVDAIIADINSGTLKPEDVQNFGPKLRDAVETQLKVNELVNKKLDGQLSDTDFNNLTPELQEAVQNQFTAEILFAGMNQAERDAKIQEVLDNQAQGKELSAWDQEILASQGPVLGPDKPAEFAARDQIAQMSPEQQKTRLEELERKIRLNETLTPQENREHSLLKNTREQSTKDYDRREVLKAKKLDKGLTEAEDQELSDLNKKLENYIMNDEQLSKAIEDLGTELMMKMATGGELTPQEESRIQELVAQKKLSEAGFTREQARAIAKKALETGGVSSERGTRRTREAREKTQELMSLELQLISTRNLAMRLREERKTAIEAAKEARKEAEEAKPEDRLRKKSAEYGKYMVISNFNAQIEGAKYSAQRINAKRVDLEQEVRRKLGVTGGLGALVEWSGAKMNNALTEITIMAEEELPFGLGAPYGEAQRAYLTATGRT